MVEAFKTINTKNGNQETIYAVIGKSMTRDDIYREVAAYKKEGLARVKSKFKRLCPGHLIYNKDNIELYTGGTNRKGAVACVIVRR